MEMRTKSVKITEYVVILLTLTTICCLVGKGIHFLYYGTEICRAFSSKKVMMQITKKD